QGRRNRGQFGVGHRSESIAFVDPVRSPVNWSLLMLSRIDLRGASLDGLRTRLPRPKAATEPPTAAVASILAAVREEGDAAVRRFTKEFDRVELEELRVPDADLQVALASISPLLREALEAARANIVSYHRSQLRDDTRHESDGIVLRELFRPVER